MFRTRCRVGRCAHTGRLDRLGLADAAVARGVKTTTAEIYEWGRRAASFPLARKGSEAVTPYPFASQHETEQLLMFGSASSVRPKGLPTRAQLT